MHKLLGHYFSYQDFTEKQTRPACVNHCVRSEPVQKKDLRETERERERRRETIECCNEYERML
jgi:hypothetical protein